MKPSFVQLKNIALASGGTSLFADVELADDGGGGEMTGNLLEEAVDSERITPS